ncbi:MAG TPA: endonuclease/exonuclease/phosphatase family protein [Acidobacteriota bacterium]|nr:endonuclease/exonuclease/phosphatase family protein [Acidobacteriota bacterium]
MILTLLNYNIWFGGRGREALLAEVIRSADPDIVLFQEAIDPGVIEKISRSTNMPFWSARKNHSNGFCSRIEFSHHEWHHPKGSRHGFLEVVPAGTKVHLFGVHLRAMFSKWGERRRVFEIEALLHHIKNHERGFHILAGDFNSLAPGELLQTTKLPRWIRALVWVSGRDIQRDTVKLIQEHGYADAFRKLHPDDKGYTFPTRDPHVRLDYVFLPQEFSDRLIDCRIVDQPPAASASDHFPLLSRFDIP